MSQKEIEQIKGLEKVMVKVNQHAQTLKNVDKTIIYLTPHIAAHMEFQEKKLQKTKKQDFNISMKVYYQAIGYRPGEKAYQNYKIENIENIEYKINNFTIIIHYDEKNDTRIILIPIHALSLTYKTIQETYETLFIQSQLMAHIIKKTKKLKILQFMTINDQEKLKMPTFDDAIKKLKEELSFPQQMIVHMGFVVKTNLDQQQLKVLNNKKNKNQFQKLDIYCIRPNCEFLYIVNKKEQHEELSSFIQMKNMEYGVFHKGFQTIGNKIVIDNSSLQSKKMGGIIKDRSLSIKSSYQKTLNNPIQNFISIFLPLITEAQQICKKDSIEIQSSSLKKTEIGDKSAIKKGVEAQALVLGQIDKNTLSYAQIRKKHPQIAQISSLANSKSEQFSYQKLTVLKVCKNELIQNYLSKNVKIPQRIKGLFVLNQLKNIRNFLKDITMDPTFKNNQLQFSLIKRIINNLFGFLYNLKDQFKCLNSEDQIDFQQLISLLQFYLNAQQIHIRCTNVKSILLENILKFLQNKTSINEASIVFYLKRIPSEQSQSLMYYDIFENILKSNQNPGNANDVYIIKKKLGVKFNKAKLLFDQHIDSKKHKIQALKLFYLDLYMQVFHENSPFFEKRTQYADEKFTALSLLNYCSKILACLNRPDLAIIIQQKLQRFGQVYRFYKQKFLKLQQKYSKQAIQQKKNAVKYFQSIMSYQKASQFFDQIISKCTNQKELEIYQKERMEMIKSRPKSQVEIIQCLQNVKKMKNVPIDRYLGDQIQKMSDE